MMRSIGIFVGDGECNAHCAHCAGRRYREGVSRFASYLPLLAAAHARGARSLTLTGSGEPTVAAHLVTAAMLEVSLLDGQVMRFDAVKLYTNGIKIGDARLHHELRFWKRLGMTDVCVTLHGL